MTKESRIRMIRENIEEAKSKLNRGEISRKEYTIMHKDATKRIAEIKNKKS